MDEVDDPERNNVECGRESDIPNPKHPDPQNSYTKLYHSPPKWRPTGAPEAFQQTSARVHAFHSNFPDPSHFCKVPVALPARVFQLSWTKLVVQLRFIDRLSPGEIQRRAHSRLENTVVNLGNSAIERSNAVETLEIVQSTRIPGRERHRARRDLDCPEAVSFFRLRVPRPREPTQNHETNSTRPYAPIDRNCAHSSRVQASHFIVSSQNRITQLQTVPGYEVPGRVSASSGGSRLEASGIQQLTATRRSYIRRKALNAWAKMDTGFSWIVSIGLIALVVSEGWAIDCFKCVSIDGDNKPCDDPFHNNGSLAFLESPCLGGRKGRDGLFPATACIKIAGIYDESGISLTVRSCALDSGTLTTDSEIIRMSHCGGFYFDDK
ncbi:hypothetical protein WN48_08020 [Eufriesea mexicana]|uniref:Protein quiver n=1 Tax=Eufriesea mexicana TaxID=516756 RepID=A0A310ST78_9HYME|nr:hypothetical protein WN48_08020 [Eufriesea mexicana]